MKIYRLSSDKEVILALFRQGNYFGEMAVIQQGQVRSATAETTEPTELFVLKRKDFEHFLEKNPRVTIKLLDVVMNRLRKANEMIEDLSFLDVRSRIMKRILRLAKEFGQVHGEGVLIDVKLTHQQMADMVGSIRETVTKVLLELQDEHLIFIDKKKIIIRDIKELEERLFAF